MTSSTPDQNAQLVTDYLEAIWEDNTWKEDILSPDYTIHNWPNDPVTVGEMQASFTTIHEAFPDLSIEFEDVIAVDDKVVVRWRFTGTHEGEYLDTPPTGNVVEFAGTGIFRVDDDQLVEAWPRSDTLELLQQIGAIPE